MTSKIDKIEYGDIILVNCSPHFGAEISKKRPYVVVSKNIIHWYSSFIVIVPLTSSIQKILDYQLLLYPSKKNGLNKPSKCLPEQIKSLDKSRVLMKLGSLEHGHINKLEKNIRFVLNQA